MHELPLVKSIFKTVVTQAEKANAKKVTRVVLEIGEIRDFIPEIVEKYWRYVSKGSLAEGSSIEITTIHATAMCGKCKTVYPIMIDNVSANRCPECGYDSGNLVTGEELNIKGIEIER